MKRLSTESSLKPYVAQFVPIKIDVASDDYKIWRRDHKPEKGAIPQMYIVRADGEELYNKVGGLPTDKLQVVLGSAIKSSGVILSDAELAQVQAVVKESSQLIEAGDMGGAVKSVSKIKGAMDSSIACYAEPVLKLRKNVQSLTESSAAEIQTISDRLNESSGQDQESSIRTAKRIVELNQNLSRFAPVKKQLQSLNRSVNKQKDLAILVSDVKKFASLKKSRRPSPTKLQELAAKYPDTSLGREVAEVLRQAKKSGADNPVFAKAGTRTWTSSDGEFTVQAKPIALADGKVTLQLANGKEIEVSLSDLSQKDQDWVKKNQ